MRGVRTPADAGRHGMREIADPVETGKLRPAIAGTFPPAEPARAHETGETGRATDKHLADTNLVVEVEYDHNAGSYGDEAVYGGGKAIRDGMAQDPAALNREGALDLVITNVVVLDPVLGVVKGDIGVRDGLIVGVGKAGNPHAQNGVDPRLVIGPGTDVISGEHLIATAGGVDTHIHFISPQQAREGVRHPRAADPGDFGSPTGDILIACDGLADGYGTGATLNDGRKATTRGRTSPYTGTATGNLDEGATRTVKSCLVKDGFSDCETGVGVHA